MKQIEVFKKIGGIIEELGEQYEYLKTVTEELNDLELELFAANAHFLADHIEVLCKLNAQRQAEKTSIDRPAKTELADKTEKLTINKPVKPATETQEPKYFEPVVQQMKYPETAAEKSTELTSGGIEFEIAGARGKPENLITNNEDAPAAEQKNETAAGEPETIRHELVLDETMIFEDDEPGEPETEAIKDTRRRKNAAPNGETKTEEIVQPVTEKLKSTEPVVIEVTEEVLTINQKISVQAGDKAISRTEQLSIKPISDLKLAITLNDKLLYVKDLFNGYNLAYSEAIEILNRFNTFDEASRFLKTNYVTKNNWDSKPATVEKFYALLRRRYA